MKRKFITILFVAIIFFLFSCNKKSEVPELIINNALDPIASSDPFVFDGSATTQNPSIVLYFHVNYSLIKYPSKIAKILVYKDGHVYFHILVSASNSYHPLDSSVARFSTYVYTFALEDTKGNISILSTPHSVYVP